MLLSLKNVEAVYMGVIQVLRAVSLEVDMGSITALLGANGAGKSTTLKAISGLLHTEEGKVSDGSIDFEGQRIDKQSPVEIARLGITQVMEGRRLFEHLTVEENIMSGVFARGGTDGQKGEKEDLKMVYGYFPKLVDLRHHTSGYLSGGEQQMLVIGRALMTRPKLMLLDEPSLGLAPLLVKEIYDIIQRINQQQKTSILLVEQNARMALSVADYGYVMETGRIVLDAPAQKLKDNEDIREFYLGLSTEGKKSYRDVKHYKRRKRWLV